MPYKDLAASYRNIGGKHYEQWSDCEPDFPTLIAEIVAAGLSYRVIKISDGERRLFREVKPKPVDDSRR